jgi:hypothetical protein
LVSGWNRFTHRYSFGAAAMAISVFRTTVPTTGHGTQAR